jgi:N utilization substance protein B
MGSRRIGRERALQALYQLDQDTALTTNAALEAAWAASDDDGPREPVAEEFARALVEGVRAHLEELDGHLETNSHNWRLDRMQRIDRSILRLGAFELKYRGDIPKSVTINEAVELGKAFGSEDSSSFINGLLDRLATTFKKA